MTRVSRRTVLRAVCGTPGLLLGISGARARAAGIITTRATDIRIVELNHDFEDHRYRPPYQFGGRSVDRVTILYVNCRVRPGDGKEAGRACRSR